MSLKAQNITVSIAGKRILHPLDFHAQPGKVTAIVGPNGSGKTTLLKAMTAELKYSGDIHLNGRNIKHESARDLANLRAVLPQATELAFPFTVLEVVRLGLTAGLSTDAMDHSDRLPISALHKTGLAGFESRFYQELSGGEKQRVQLARVLVQIWQPVWQGQARWLFLDEPVSALDIGHQLSVMQIAKDYARAGGGVIAVMHDLNLTSMFADHMTLMRQGQVLASGTPEHVMTNTNLSLAYGCPLNVNTAPSDDVPWLLPQSAQPAAQFTPMKETA